MTSDTPNSGVEAYLVWVLLALLAIQLLAAVTFAASTPVVLDLGHRISIFSIGIFVLLGLVNFVIGKVIGLGDEMEEL